MRRASTFTITTAVLISGLSIGAWRAWHTGRPSQPLAGSGAGVVEISMITTQSKRDWVSDRVYAFNYAHPLIHLTFKFIESRSAMQDILYGKEKPDLWSPDSPSLVSALVDNWSKAHGTSIVDTSNPAAFRVFQRSPIVFLTTKKKAVFLRPLLGGPGAWDAIRKLGANPASTPWGKFSFMHADPTNDATALLMLALILNEYAQERGQNTDIESVANSADFGQYLAQVERGMVRNDISRSGTYGLTRAYITNKYTVDFVVTTESSGLTAAVADPDLAVIYPDPTAETEESVCVLNGPWSTQDKESAAMEFMSAISQPEATQSALKLYLRPADATEESSYSPRVVEHAGQGFAPSYATVELPSYTTLNAALYVWCNDVVHVNYNIAQ